MVKQKLTLFISYLEFFHNIHTKHFKRFSKKMKLMDDYINDDIQFDESPRRKMSKDFDDLSSDGGSSSGGPFPPSGGGGGEVPLKIAPRKSLLKKSVDSVINGLKSFGKKSNPIVDLTNTNSNVNLVISESSSEISDLDNVITSELSEDNIAAINRERSATISKQLNEDPKMMTKMFDELTKTFDDEEIKSVKSNSSKASKRSTVSKKSNAVVEEEANVEEANVEEANIIQTNEVEETSEIIDNILNDVNLNNQNALNNANKKKKKGKKK